METKWDRAFVPEDKRQIHATLRKMIRNMGFRKLTPADSNTTKRDVIVIHTDGHMGKLIFVGYDEYPANIGAVGNHYADIHVPATGYNIRTAYDNGFVLIKDKKGE